MYMKIFTLLLFSLSLIWGEINTSKRNDYALFSKSKEIKHPHHTIAFKFIDKEHSDQSLTEKELQEAMGVDVKSDFEFWKDYNPTLKDRLIPTLDVSMRSYLDSEGYYDSNYTIKVDAKSILVTIKENRPVRVMDINITSDYPIEDLISFKKNDIFTAKEFIAIKGAIIKAVMKDGYCSYQLDSKAYVDLDRYRADLVYKLQKGGVCTFGKVTVTGVETIDDNIIVSRVRAAAGERFDTERIQESYDALYNLNAFDSVSIKYDRKFYNVVPIDINVSEISKPWYFLGGVGYDTDIGPRAWTEIIRKNFMGDARKLRLRVQYSKKEQLAEISLFSPAFWSIHHYFFDLSTKIGYSNLEYTGFMEKKLYAQAYLTYTNEALKINAGMAVEAIDISLLDDYDRDKLTQDITEGNFFLIYPFTSFIYDKRDSKLNPKYGYYFAGMLEYGLPYEEEASEYIKYELEGRAIYTLYDLTMAMVAKVGIVDESENTLPESKLFFEGGVDSNRAYGYRRLGVIISPTRYGIDGAYTMANLSLEVDYPLLGDIYGALFNDNTMLTINSYDFTGDIISSAGFGLRYVTPIGPIKVDLGMNVQDPKQYGIHFKIGQSF